MVEISVIVPMYNTEPKKIQRCLESVNIFIKSGMKKKLNIECIIIDDGSEDLISNWCEKYCCELGPWFRYHRIVNSGVSNARNIGIKYSCGKYLMFVDSDDEILSENIFKLPLDEEYDIIFTDLNVINSKQNLIWKAFDKKRTGNIDIFDVLEKVTSDGKLNGPYCKIIKKDIITVNKIEFRTDMILGEDCVFLLNIIRNSNRMYYSNLVTYNYFLDMQTSNNRLINNTEKVLDNIDQMYFEMLKDIDLVQEDIKIRLRTQASARFIKQVFNTGADLISLGELNNNNKDRLYKSINLINTYTNDSLKFNRLIRIELFILSNKMWRLLFLSSALRKVYLKLKK